VIVFKSTIVALALAFSLLAPAKALEAGKWIILGTIFVHGEHERFITLGYNEESSAEPVAFGSEETCNTFKNTNKNAQTTFAKLTKLASDHEDVFFDVHCVKVPVIGKDS
jgi:hypothetical protein